MLGLTTGLMLYKPELSFGQISLLLPLVSTNSSIMASDQGKVDFTVYGKELLQMSPHVHDIYGSLLNNGIYAIQHQCKMDMDVIKYSMRCHYGLVRSVYIQSPQVAYVDLCLGKELISDEFKGFLFTGIHRADFPDSLVHDCDVVFHPLAQKI